MFQHPRSLSALAQPARCGLMASVHAPSRPPFDGYRSTPTRQPHRHQESQCALSASIHAPKRHREAPRNTTNSSSPGRLAPPHLRHPQPQGAPQGHIATVHHHTEALPNTTSEAATALLSAPRGAIAIPSNTPEVLPEAASRPTTTDLSAPGATIEEVDCPICLLPLAHGSCIVQPSCHHAHLYHIDCLYTWLTPTPSAAEPPRNCPSCRAEIKHVTLAPWDAPKKQLGEGWRRRIEFKYLRAFDEREEELPDWLVQRLKEVFGEGAEAMFTGGYVREDANMVDVLVSELELGEDILRRTWRRELFSPWWWSRPGKN